MANRSQPSKRLFLLKNTMAMGELFYVVNKSDILLTDDSDIKINSKVQFLAEKRAKKQKKEKFEWEEF